MVDTAVDDGRGVTPLPMIPRSRTLLVGTGFAVAAAYMYFAGLLGAYWAERASVRRIGGDWLPSDALLELTPTTMIFFTLVMSCVTMQWAVYSIARDDRRHAYMALGVTGILGLMVVNQAAFQFRQMGLVIDDVETSAPVLIYVLSGSHIAVLVGGLLFLAVTAFRALAGQYSSRNVDGVAAAAMWWYAMVFLYAFLWLGVFVAK